VAHNPVKPTPANTKPGVPTPVAQFSSRFSMKCGSCHNCKATPTTGMIAQQPVPTPRLPSLPALAPAPVVQRPLLTYLGPAPVVTQPFAPLGLLPAPQPLPSLTLSPTLLTAVTSPPKITRSPGQDRLGTVATAPTAFLSTPPPLVTALPDMVAEMSPPSLAKVERAGQNGAQLPPLAEVLVPAEAEKPAATPAVARQQGPSLIYVLLEPPLLPSGAYLAPRDVVHPALDEPPVLPALVDTLIQPPALPPVPGA
jgi:hypothetical protein